METKKEWTTFRTRRNCGNKKKLGSLKLCKNFPEQIKALFIEVINRKAEENPDYKKIINEFELLKDKLYINNENKDYKFKWIKLFKDTIINNNYNIEKLKKSKYKNFFNIFNL